jgi:Tfp pilus assembly protein PilF
MNLSILYQIHGENGKALNLLEQIEHNYGKSIEIYTQKYSIYLSVNKDKKAIQQLYSAHEKDPANLSIMGLIAEFYRDSGIKDSAKNYYDHLLKNDSKDPVSIFSYIDYLLHFNEYKEAIRFFNTSLNGQIINKEQTMGYFINKLESENILLEHKVFYDTAMASFSTLNADDIKVKALYVDYHFKLKEYNKAADELREMKLQNEGNYRIWEELLFAENTMDQYDSLIMHGERAIYLFEDQPMPYLYAGIGYLQEKNYTKALNTMDKGFKYAENKNIYLQYCIFMAEAYNGLQNRTKAFEYYEKALSIDSENQLVKNNYAYFLCLEGKDLRKAELMSHETIEKEKKNAIYLDTYAWILYALERRARAKHYIRKAMKNGGEIDKDIKEHYTVIFKNKGEQKN